MSAQVVFSRKSMRPSGTDCRLTIRPLDAPDEASVDAFVLGHGEHGPGHRRALVALERALGHRELSVVAELNGAVVGYAPAFLMPAPTLRYLRTGIVAGGSLVGCGPLISDSLDEPERAVVLTGLVRHVQRATRSAGAHWLRYVYSPIAGDRSTLVQCRPFPLLALGLPLRTIVSPVLDLRQPESVLWSQLSATTRNLVRNGERRGLRATVHEAAPAFDALASFRAQAATAFGGHPRASLAFDALREVFDACEPGPRVAHTLLVGADGVALSAVVTCESNRTSYYFLAFNAPEAHQRHANRVALWHAILHAKARGNHWFLLGSLDFGDTKAARISEFKRQFGGVLLLSPMAEWCARRYSVAAVQAATLLVQRVRSRRG